MTDFTFDAIGGELGRSAKSYQKTLKRKPCEAPWREVRIRIKGKAFVSFSFDGRAYSKELILESCESVFPLAARAVRVRVSRSTDIVYFSLYCRD